MRFKKVFNCLLVFALLLVGTFEANAAEIQPDALLNSGDNFGSSVAVFDKWAMVGASGDSSFAGKVYVFEKGGSVWTESTTLPGSGFSLKANDYFGSAVDVSENIAVVGAYGTDIDPFLSDDTNDLISNAGAAYVFENDGSGWSQTPIVMLTAYDGKANFNYGVSAGVFDNYVIVGAPGAYGERGAAYIYKEPSAGWENVLMEEDAIRLMAGTSNIQDFFGFSVAISDEYAVVGAYGVDDASNGDRSGSVYVFQRGGDGSWAQSAILPNEALNNLDATADGFKANDKLGFSVAIDGDILVVGAPGVSPGTGKVYVFSHDGAQWIITDEIAESGVFGFGTSVSIRGNYIAVGTESGAAYLYERSLAGEWTAADASPFGPQDGNGSVSEVAVSVSAGGYDFFGGMPDRNSNEGAVYTGSEALDLTVGSANVKPSILSISDQIMRYGETLILPLDVSDLETTVSNLTLTSSIDFASEKTTLTSDVISSTLTVSGLAIKSTSTDPDVALGTAEVTVTVTDWCTGTATECTACDPDPSVSGPACPKSDSTTFVVTVGDIPGIEITTPLEERIMNESGSLTVDFNVTDPGSLQGFQSPKSSNQVVIPDSNLFLSHATGASTGSISIQPNPGQFGKVQITITAQAFDGNLISETFLVTVNSLPEFKGLSQNESEIIPLANETYTYSFRVDDVETDPSALTPVLDITNIIDGGVLNGDPQITPVSGSVDEWTLSVPVKSNIATLPSSVQIPLTLSDLDGGTEDFTFTLEITDDPRPSITRIYQDKASVDQNFILSGFFNMNEGDVVSVVYFDIKDADTDPADMDFSVAVSSDWLQRSDFETATPSCTSAGCGITVNEPGSVPAGDLTPATVTITANDLDPSTSNAVKSFKFDYNKSPKIGITDPPIAVNEDETVSFTFSISDEDDDFQSLLGAGTKLQAVNVTNDYLFKNLPEPWTCTGATTYTCESPNNYLTENCTEGSSETVCTVTLDFPGHEVTDEVSGDISIEPNISGQATFKILADDGLIGASVENSFTLKVNAVNDLPSVKITKLGEATDPSSPFIEQVIEEDGEFLINFTVTDYDGDPLTISANSTNTALIQNSQSQLTICKTDESKCYGPTYQTSGVTSEPLVLKVMPGDNVNSELTDGTNSIGSTDITISADDLSGETPTSEMIPFSVEPSPDAPEITPPYQKKIVDEEGTTDPIFFDINDPDGGSSDGSTDLRIEVADKTIFNNNGVPPSGYEPVIPIDQENVYFVDETGAPLNFIDSTAVAVELTPSPAGQTTIGVVVTPPADEDGDSSFILVVKGANDFDESDNPLVKDANGNPLVPATADFDVDINPVPDQPRVLDLDTTLETEEDTALEPKKFKVFDPDTPFAGITAEAVWKSGVEGGDLSLTPAADPTDPDNKNRGEFTLSITPPKNYPDDLVIELRVSDGVTETTVEDINLAITPVNDVPVISGIPESPIAVNEDDPVPAELLKVQDPETANQLEQLNGNVETVWTWFEVPPSLLTIPPTGTAELGANGINSTTGDFELVITPPSDLPLKGNDVLKAKIKVTITDNEGGSSDNQLNPVNNNTIDLWITGVNDAPVITPATLVEQPVKEDHSFTFNFTVEDQDTIWRNLVFDPTFENDNPLTDLDIQFNDPYATCVSETDHKAKCKLIAKPGKDQYGKTTVLLTANDGLSGTATAKIPLDIQSVNDPVEFEVEPLWVTAEGKAIPVDYTAFDPEGDPITVTVEGAGLGWAWDDPNLTPDAVVEKGNGDIINVDPPDFIYGVGTVTLKVSDGNLADDFTRSFKVKVTPENDPPAITNLVFSKPDVGEEDFIRDEDEPFEFKFDISDPDLDLVNNPVDYNKLTVTAKAVWENPDGSKRNVPDQRVSLTGSTKTRTLTVRPLPDAVGKARITATVTDDVGAFAKSPEVVVTYTEVDDPPSIVKATTTLNEIIKEDKNKDFPTIPALTVEFIVADVDTDLAGLALIAEPANPALKPSDGSTYNPYVRPDNTLKDATRKVIIDPPKDWYGESDITVSVVDEAAPTEPLDSVTFHLTVTPVNDPPTISNLKIGNTDQSSVDLLEGQSTQEAYPSTEYIVEISDVDTPIENLTLGADWSSVTGYPFVKGSISFGEAVATSEDGTEAESTIIIAAPDGESGRANIRMWVKDSNFAAPRYAPQTFQLRVAEVNDPPVVTLPIPPIEKDSTEKIVYAVNDVETVVSFGLSDSDSFVGSSRATTKMDVRLFSDNTDLVPNNDKTRLNWDFGPNPSSNLNCILKITPRPIAGITPEEANITVTAIDDGGAPSVPERFKLRVVSEAFPPSINLPPGQVIKEDSDPFTLEFKVFDEEKDKPSELNVSAAAGAGSEDIVSVEQPVLVTDSYTADANFSITIDPIPDVPNGAPDATTDIVVTVFNGVFPATATVSVTVQQVNDPPVISLPAKNDVYRTFRGTPITIEVNISDIEENPPADLIVEAVETGTNFIDTFEYGGEFGDRTLTITPKAGVTQETALITLTVTDTLYQPRGIAEVPFGVTIGDPQPGDVNGDGKIGLGDVIAVLQLLAGIDQTQLPPILIEADIDNDGQIGFAEALNALREAAAK